MASPTPASDEPFCGNCGYKLSGLVDSSKCPECGRPLVEVVSRRGPWGRRFRSQAKLFGLPIIDVALGPRPGERIGRACGIIAIGDSATGLLAIGGFAKGLVAVGGMSMGGLSIGGMSIGIFSAIGGFAMGGLAAGGGAFGVFASGGAAAGYMASGGLAAGYYASGGAPFGVHTLGPGSNSPVATDMFDTFAWFFGGAVVSPMTMLQPLLTCTLLTGAVAAGVALMAVLGHWRSRGRADSAAAV